MNQPATKNKGGRPRRTTHERLDLKERKKQLSLTKILEDINTDITLLRDQARTEATTNAQVGALKAALGGNLHLLDKLIPSIKAVEHTGQLDHQHSGTVQHVNNNELAMRLVLFKQQNQQLLDEAETKVIEHVPDKEWDFL